MKTLDLLQKITAFPAVSGNETGLIRFLRSEAEKLGTKVKIDSFGNLVCQKGDGYELAVFAHVDKVGFKISKIGKKLEVVGLFDEVEEKVATGKKSNVVIFGQNYPQYASLVKQKNKIELVKSSKRGVEIGDTVTYQPNFQIKSGKILSQGLDNGLGVVAALHFLKYLKIGTVVFSTQEEMGFYGAQAAAKYLKPKKVLIIDTTYADDPRSDVKLGGGVVFCVKDNFLSDKKMLATAKNICKVNGFKFQVEVLVSGKSDIAGVYSGYGVVPHLFIGIPIKNMHTSQEIAAHEDLEIAIKFLKIFASCFG